MKYIFIISLITLIFISKLNAQKVYSVNYNYQADIKIFVTNYDYQADLLVYKVKYEIFFTKYDYQADLKIYFVDHDYQAGWKNSEKKHLLF